MSTFVVAKKEFADGIRSRSLLALVALFALLLAVAAFLHVKTVPSDTWATMNAANRTFSVIQSLLTPTAILMPIIGTFLGYNAIAGERESGSLKLLLGLPHTRRNVVFGKLLGRSAIITVAVLAGFSVGGIVMFALIDAVMFGYYAVFTGMTILIGVVFVSTAIAFSSAVRSPTVATWGAVGLALLFVFGWESVVVIVGVIADQFGLAAPPPGTPPWRDPYWLTFLRDINPTHTFSDAVNAVGRGVTTGSFGFVILNPPFYLEWWFRFVILGFWLTVPLGLAYFRFNRIDL